jgi:hypothetical protein
MDPAIQQRYKIRFGEPPETAENAEGKPVAPSSSGTTPLLVPSNEIVFAPGEAAESLSSDPTGMAKLPDAVPQAPVTLRQPAVPQTALHTAITDILCRLTCVNEEARKQIASQLLLIG